MAMTAAPMPSSLIAEGIPALETLQVSEAQNIQMSPAGKKAAAASPASTASTAASPVGKEGSPAKEKAAKSGKENAVMLQLAKTKMCTFFQRGRCASNNCRYAHSSTELRHQPNMQKTKLCKEFLQGNCQDKNCMFAHGETDLRVTQGIYKTQMCNFFERGYCKKGDRCNHAHGSVDLRPPAEAKVPAAMQQFDTMASISTPSPVPKHGESPLGAYSGSTAFNALGDFVPPSSTRAWRSPLPLTELLVDNEANMHAQMPMVPPTPTKSVVELASMAYSPLASSPLWGYGGALVSPAPGLSNGNPAMGRYDPVEVLLDHMRANPQNQNALASNFIHATPPPPPTVPAGPLGGYPLGLELQRPPTMPEQIQWQMEQPLEPEWLSPPTPMHFANVPPPPALSPPPVHFPSHGMFSPGGIAEVPHWQSEHVVSPIREHDPVAINLSDRLASLDAVVRGLSADIATMRSEEPAARTPVKVPTPSAISITTGEVAKKTTHKL